MHIPAMDALRHERVGIVSADGPIMVLKTYVRTGDTEERGAYDPVEGFARPFPMMLHSGGDSIGVENIVRDGVLEPFSDALIEYTSFLYESMMEEEWLDAVDEFDDERLSDVEKEVASSLMGFATAEKPPELFRSVYEAAGRLESTGDVLDMNSLVDIEGREQYDFEYLPAIEDVDEWQLLRYVSDVEVEGVDEPAVSETLWVRYTVGDTEHERPIVAYQNGVAGLTASSESVDFGSDGEDDVTPAFVSTLLSVDGAVTDIESNLLSVDPSEFENTRSLEYLEAYIENAEE